MAKKKSTKPKKYRKHVRLQQGRQLTEFQKASIVQAYALTGNKSQVSRELGFSRPTIDKVLLESETNLQLQKARTRALDDVAGRVHHKAVEILDSISPEDIESGLIKKFDDDGNLVQVKGYGPSLMQKVTSAAILTDKLKVIEETKQAIGRDQSADANHMPLPGDIESALRRVGDKIRHLRVLDVQFDHQNPEVVSKVQEVAHRASLNTDIEDAVFEELDFDNPVERPDDGSHDDCSAADAG